ncbi:hypothetical protein [Glycomyces sp. MUSA5-2]|uniref:hypothetical protein n=1 Tax=Glycomyces sp. MUSA5-2 TaxID=2053002 RepID=UPI003008E588
MTRQHPHQPTGSTPTPCDPAWRQVSADLTDLLAVILGTGGTTVVATPGAGHGAAGAYLKAHNVVELDTDLCCPGLAPDEMDVADSFDHFWYPVLIGVLCHQSAHVRHSQWDLDDAWPFWVARSAVLLEEVRIEAAHLKRRPDDRQWLRSAADQLQPAAAAASSYPLLDLAQAAEAACLTLGRVDAGVFDRTDPGITAARQALHAVLGADLLNRLQQLWRGAIICPDTDTGRMKDLAVAWSRALINRQAKDRANTAAATGAFTAVEDAIADALAQIAADAPTAADPDAATGWNLTGGGGGAGGNSTAEAGKQLWDKFTSPEAERDPTSEEHAAKATLGAAIKKAAQRPPGHTSAPAALPPGRLNMRGVQSAAAQRAAGALVSAQMWKQRAKAAPADPEARVGIAVDVSGSMSDWFDPAGSAAWIFAHATKISGGAAAATTFGERPRALLAVGETPEKVPQPVLEYATDHADVAIAGLIAALDLDQADGNTRALVLITDGDLAASQRQVVADQCKQLTEAGCAVIQLGPARSRPLAHAEHIPCPKPSAVIDVLADAVTDALAKAAKAT